MIRRPPRSTRTDTLFPYTTLLRSAGAVHGQAVLRSRRSAGCGGRRDDHHRADRAALSLPVRSAGDPPPADDEPEDRSEERRVGKEWVSTWRYRWSPDHEKKKTRTSKSDKDTRHEKSAVRTNQ